jgi:hypothetical protein
LCIAISGSAVLSRSWAVARLTAAAKAARRLDGTQPLAENGFDILLPLDGMREVCGVLRRRQGEPVGLHPPTGTAIEAQGARRFKREAAVSRVPALPSTTSRKRPPNRHYRLAATIMTRVSIRP